MRRMLRRRTIFFGVTGALVAGAAVSITLLAGLLGASGQEPPRSAANDAEWIQMIRDAKNANAGKTPLAPPSVPAGAILTYDCAEIPATATLSQQAAEISPDGTDGRWVFDFVDFATNPVGQHYELAVPWDGPEQKCANEAYNRPVNASRGVSGNQTAVASGTTYICEQMALSAAGKPRTDNTLPPASAEVAKEYLKAFCQ